MSGVFHYFLFFKVRVFQRLGFFFITELQHCSETLAWYEAEMSTDQDWSRTEANFGRIWTGSDCNFFQNSQIRN